MRKLSLSMAGFWCSAKMLRNILISGKQMKIFWLQENRWNFFDCRKTDEIFWLQKTDENILIAGKQMPDPVLRESEAQPSKESKWGNARLVDSTTLETELEKKHKFFNSGKKTQIFQLWKTTQIYQLWKITQIFQLWNKTQISCWSVDVIIQPTWIFWMSRYFLVYSNSWIERLTFG